MHTLIEALYNENYNSLYKFISKMHLNSDEIEDIIQNTFVEALKSIETCKNEKCIKTWLFSIARRQVYKYFKRKNIINVDAFFEDIIDPNLTAFDKTLTNEIMDYLKTLPKDIMLIMQMRLIEGRAFSEISRTINQSETYCRVNFYRIKEKIKEEYDYEEM